MVNPKSIIGKKISNIYFELTDFNNSQNLSNASFEIILVLENNNINSIRFIANNDKVEIQETEILNDEEILNSFDQLMNSQIYKAPIQVIDFSTDKYFKNFINQHIENIEVEKYSDGELVGFKITLSNNSIFEVYPNTYSTSGHFYNLEKYFPVKVKYLADETFWVQL